MKPEDLAVIGHKGDLLVDIYTAKCDAYLHFTAVLNDGGEDAQSRRNGCSISAVTVRNLTRNTQVEKTKELVREGKELVWSNEKTTGLENRHGISLDDPRVTETFYNLREAAKNEPAKVNAGPEMSISG